MLLRGEINYFVRSLRHYPVLIFPHLLSSLIYAQFSDIKCGTKLKSKNYITVFTSHVKTRHKNNYRWIYLNTCIITTFFRPVQTLCNHVSRASSLYDINVKKIKTPLETNLEFKSSFKTSVDARVEGLALNVGF